MNPLPSCFESVVSGDALRCRETPSVRGWRGGQFLARLLSYLLLRSRFSLGSPAPPLPPPQRCGQAFGVVLLPSFIFEVHCREPLFVDFSWGTALNFALCACLPRRRRACASGRRQRCCGLRPCKGCRTSLPLFVREPPIVCRYLTIKSRVSTCYFTSLANIVQIILHVVTTMSKQVQQRGREPIDTHFQIALVDVRHHGAQVETD